jgi:hypothetical protein
VVKIARLSLLFLLTSGCGGGHRHAPIASPDGSMTLNTRIEQSRSDPATHLCVIFEIRDSSGRIVHSENTRASDAMSGRMSWVANDQIRLESSDIGTYHWRRPKVGPWAQHELHPP